MTDLVKQEACGSLALYGDLMDNDKAKAQDIIIPKILVMQAVSQFVHDDKAKSGELRGSLEANLLAGRGEALDFIAFSKFKTRITFANVKGKQEYVGQVPWGAEHEGAERTEIVDGQELMHYETLNYYVLLVDDIAQDLAFPYLISFRSTGYKAGKVLETYRTKLQMAGKPLPFKVFSIGAEQVENDKGTFYAPTISMGRNSTDLELSHVKKWFDLVKTAEVKVDDSDLKSEGTDTSEINDAF